MLHDTWQTDSPTWDWYSENDWEEADANYQEKNLSYVLRHSAEVRYDSESCVRLSELMSARHSIVNNLLTPSQLLVAMFANPNQRFQVSFPTYRMSGSSRKQYVMPDIGLRAVQGHSTGGDTSLEYLIAAQ